jgi:hypothetical protein
LVFQEFIEQNGVVNCLERPKWEQPRNLSADIQPHSSMTYRCSTVQGNIVIGHTTNYEVGPENAQYLRRLSRKLAADLNSDIQLEFVIDGTVKIVQLRVLKTKL